MAWSVVFACTIPLLIVLAVNQVSLLLKTTSDREEEVSALMATLPKSASIMHFPNSSAAMKYLAANIDRCSRFYNTRLVLPEVEAKDPLNARTTSALDAAVLRRIREGMDYCWIVSPPYENAAAGIHEQRTAWVRRGLAAGSYSAWILPEAQLPFFHFCILQYGQDEELLVGWAIAAPSDFGERVFLIRDQRFVDYFRGLFKLYAAHGREL